MLTRKWPILILILFLIRSLEAQVDSSNYVKYTTDYKFTDGIFLFFEQVKQNTPLPKTRIITSINYDHPQFFDILLQQNSISFYDNLGQQQTITTSNIWGYAKNGVLYIKINNTFSRITLVGTISHFVATHTSYSNYPSMGYGMGYYDQYNSMNNTSTELRQYILDFNTGKVYNYTEQNLLLLFMQDEQVYDEYNSLRKKKKRTEKFIFLRKFNERNSLMLPANQGLY